MSSVADSKEGKGRPDRLTTSGTTSAVDKASCPLPTRYATWRKKTPGVLFLRKLLHKFLVIDGGARADAFGAFFIMGMKTGV